MNHDRPLMSRQERAISALYDFILDYLVCWHYRDDSQGKLNVISKTVCRYNSPHFTVDVWIC